MTTGSDIFHTLAVIYLCWGGLTIGAWLYYRGPIAGSLVVSSAVFGLAMLTIVLVAMLIFAATGAA